MNARRHVTIYTRGISSPSGAGGYGVVLLCEGQRRELQGGALKGSNNRMDLTAAVEGLRALKYPCRVTLYNGNAYLTDAISKGYARRWRDSGWTTAEGRPTAHADLWDAVLDLCSVHEAEFLWKRFDPSNPEYACCDRLAHQAAARCSDQPPEEAMSQDGSGER